VKFDDFRANHGILTEDEETIVPYILREEQEKAVELTLAYAKTHDNGEFLWNAKPRFGKTLSAYDLCKRLDATNILIVTNRPAIANSWYSDYETFFGPQSGYVFVSNVDGIKDRKYVYSREGYLDKLRDFSGDNEVKGCIEFVSLQDLKGSIYFGGQYDKLAELSA
jgi:superfamily II DNA or RNA helicase